MPLSFLNLPSDWPTWRQYVFQIRHHARQLEFPSKPLKDCILYAKRLHRRGLPVIYEHTHLASLVGYDTDYLFGVANHAAKYYRSFEIPKKSGGLREIREPLPSLKEIQHWILLNILNRIQPNQYAKGFVTGRSIVDNARFHRGQRIVLTVDIKDFFPSINAYRVYRIFRECCYTKAVAMLLARLCTLEDQLPQGAPTSPAISNAVAKSIDNRLGGFARSEKIRFSRYADDMTFSGDFVPGPVISFVERVLYEEGFSLNSKKTRVLKPHQRQVVTGVVVNKHLRAPRRMRMELRQALHYIQKFGIAAHMQKRGIKNANYVLHLLGIASHITSINPKDRDATEAVRYFGRF